MINDIFFNSRLLGLDCWSISLTYPNSLVLDIGKKIEYILPKFGKQLKGEWSIISEYCHWRVRRSEKFLCGSYLNEEESGVILQELVLGKLIDLKHNRNDDFTFIFENSIEVDFLCATNDDIILSIYTKDLCYSYIQNDKWFENDNNEGLTESEKIIDNHSFNCNKRWQNIIPKQIGNLDYCNNCFYYLPIRGIFYFFDYGLCSNSKSVYDGKVVGIKSSCEYFNKNIDI